MFYGKIKNRLEEEITLMWKHPPVKFGLFHIFFVLLAIVLLGIAIYFGYHFQGKEKQKKRDLILTITGLNLVAMDIGKMIFDFARHRADWSLVPLQLCSTALLILPLPYFLKERKIQRLCLWLPCFYQDNSRNLLFRQSNNVI